MSRVFEVRTKIIDEAFCGYISCDKKLLAVLESLPEFQEPKWIKCSERMPMPGAPVYWCFDTLHEVVSGIGVAEFCAEYWMPRYIPAPPVEDDSPQVKELKAVFLLNGMTVESSATLGAAIAIVKRHEKANGG